MTRLGSYNAFETTTTSGISDDPNDDDWLVDFGGLAPPLPARTWIVIDPDIDDRREYALVESVGINTLTVSNRGATGSFNNSPQPHDAGAIIRTVPVSQWLDEIFDDIEGNTGDFADHIDPGQQPNPHPDIYLLLSGGVMTGPIDMGASKIVDLAAATVGSDAARLDQISQAVSDHEDPTPPNDPHPQYVLETDLGGPYLPLAGGVMTGAISFGTDARISAASSQFLVEAEDGGSVRDVATLFIGPQTQPVLRFATAWNNANQGAILEWPATTAATVGSMQLARTNDELRFYTGDGADEVLTFTEAGVANARLDDQTMTFPPVGTPLMRNITINNGSPAGDQVRGTINIDPVSREVEWYDGAAWQTLGYLSDTP